MTTADVSLMIPETCPRGHLLEPRTVTLDIRIVQHTKTSRRLDATSWRCVPCVRADVYTAHTGEPAPAEMLRAENFCRQFRWNSSSAWHERVRFCSGASFDRPDDTPAKEPKRAPRTSDMRYRDPTAVAALSATVGATQNRPEPTWRDFLDSTELPTEADREDVEELGLDAWREARAYVRYRRHRHGRGMTGGYLKRERKRPPIIAVSRPHSDRTQTAVIQPSGFQAKQTEIERDSIGAGQRLNAEKLR